MERAVDFLVKELKVCSQKEANERIFFVSAKEALQARLQEQKGQPAHSMYTHYITRTQLLIYVYIVLPVIHVATVCAIGLLV